MLSEIQIQLNIMHYKLIYANSLEEFIKKKKLKRNGTFLNSASRHLLKILFRINFY